MPGTAIKRMSVPGMRPPSRDGGDTAIGSPSRIARPKRLSTTGAQLQQRGGVPSLMSPPSLKPAGAGAGGGFSGRSPDLRGSSASPRPKRASTLGGGTTGLSARPAASENRQSVVGAARPDMSGKVAALERSLEEATAKIERKDEQIETLQKLLDECDEQLREMHALAMKRESELATEREKHESEGSVARSGNPKLLKMLEDKERKLDALRAEFDRTVEKLSDDNLETVHHYETKLARVESERDTAVAKLEKASVELQQFQYMQSMDSGDDSGASNGGDVSARARMIRLADVENRLLEREAELREASEKIELLKEAAGGDARGQAAELERELASERSRAEEYANEISSLKARIEELTSRAEGQAPVSTDDTTAAIQSRLDKETELRREADKILAQVREELQAAKADADELRAEVQSLRASRDEVKGLGEKSGVELEELHQVLEDLRSHATNLEKDNADLHTANEDLRAKMAELENKAAETSSAKAPATTTTTADDDEKLKQDLENERAEVARLREELENVESLLETKILREADLERQIDSLRSISSPEGPVTPTKTHHNLDVADKPAVPDGDVGVYASPQKLDPAAGRELWCGLCEKSGHESYQCPFADEF